MGRKVSQKPNGKLKKQGLNRAKTAEQRDHGITRQRQNGSR